MKYNKMLYVDPEKISQKRFLDFEMMKSIDRIKISVSKLILKFFQKLILVNRQFPLKIRHVILSKDQIQSRYSFVSNLSI